MNFLGLVVHGLSAISVFADVVSVRLLVSATAFALVSLLLLAAAVSAGFAAPHSVPSWAAVAVDALVVICLEAMMLSLSLVWAVISARSNSRFIPLRDSESYILEQKELWGKHDATGIPRRRIGAAGEGSLLEELLVCADLSVCRGGRARSRSRHRREH
jgi:hypothetical protein